MRKKDYEILEVKVKMTIEMFKEKVKDEMSYYKADPMDLTEQSMQDCLKEMIKLADEMSVEQIKKYCEKMEKEFREKSWNEKDPYKKEYYGELVTAYMYVEDYLIG